jgi:hypothetical protein
MKQLIITAICASLCSVSLQAANEKPKPGSKAAPSLTPEELKKAEDQYFVPSPSDLLEALDHSGAIDWTALSAGIGKVSSPEKDYPNDSDKALNLGIRVADAFVAAKARNKDQLQESSASVAKLGVELSADKGLAEKREQVKKLLNEGKWQELSELLEAIRGQVLGELQTAKDQDSVTLANLGGWLRGLNLVSGALSKDYKAESTKVLRQPGLLEFLQGRLGKLGPGADKSKAVIEVKAKLGEIKELCTFGKDATLPEGKVKRLHEITNELIKSIQG